MRRTDLALTPLEEQQVAAPGLATFSHPQTAREACRRTQSPQRCHHRGWLTHGRDRRARVSCPCAARSGHTHLPPLSPSRYSRRPRCEPSPSGGGLEAGKSPSEQRPEPPGSAALAEQPALGTEPGERPGAPPGAGREAEVAGCRRRSANPNRRARPR